MNPASKLSLSPHLLQHQTSGRLRTLTANSRNTSTSRPGPHPFHNPCQSANMDFSKTTQQQKDTNQPVSRSQPRRSQICRGCMAGTDMFKDRGQQPPEQGGGQPEGCLPGTLSEPRSGRPQRVQRPGGRDQGGTPQKGRGAEQVNEGC